MPTKRQLRIWGWCLMMVAAPLGAVGLASARDGSSTPVVLIPCSPAYASYGSGSAELFLVADTPGLGGNSIVVNFQVTVPNSPLAVSVLGNTITVTLATDGAAQPTSTAADVAAALQAEASAAALIDAYLGGDGSGIVAAGSAPLAGGTECSIGVESLPWGTAKRILSDTTSQ